MAALPMQLREQEQEHPDRLRELKPAELAPTGVVDLLGATSHGLRVPPSLAEMEVNDSLPGNRSYSPFPHMEPAARSTPHKTALQGENAPTLA